MSRKLLPLIDRMVYSRQLQATHSYQSPAWKGVWRDRKGRSWYVEACACAEHAPKWQGRKSQLRVDGQLDPVPDLQ